MSTRGATGYFMWILTHFILKRVQMSCGQCLIISTKPVCQHKKMDMPSFKIDMFLLFLRVFKHDIALESR